MSNLTPEELAILDSIHKPRNQPNAEMYYNYSCSGSYSYSDSTLQQSTGPSDPTNESVSAPEAQFSSPSPSGTDVEKAKEVRKSVEVRKNVPRKISLNDYYVQINMSVNEIRRGKRTDRMNAYLSIREDNDKKFGIYLRASLTSSIDETFRSIRKTDNRILEQALIDMGSNCPSDAKFFSGRLRYNPRKWKIEDEHKTNLKSALIGIYDYGTHMTCTLFMLGEWYVIELSDDLTTKQQGMFDFTGIYERDVKEEE